MLGGNLEEIDLRLLRAAQEGIPLTERPFLALALETGISEQEAVERMARLCERGVIRRFAATVGHRALGIVANAMIVWKVPARDVERVGAIFVSFEEVTHCYQRRTTQEWPYSLYTMVHGRSRDECCRIAGELSRASGVEEYEILFSEKEYKKTSARI
jgi:DNA-binding Lrp family transcriptional regulator